MGYYTDHTIRVYFDYPVSLTQQNKYFIKPLDCDDMTNHISNMTHILHIECNFDNTNTICDITINTKYNGKEEVLYVLNYIKTINLNVKNIAYSLDFCGGITDHREQKNKFKFVNNCLMCQQTWCYENKVCSDKCSRKFLQKNSYILGYIDGRNYLYKQIINVVWKIVGEADICQIVFVDW